MVNRRDTSQGVDDLTIFTGYYGDVFEAIQAFDVFVLPAEIEGLPYVVLEAMSQAKPVVATNVGGIPEAVLSGKTGFVVPPGDPIALAEGIARILEDPLLTHEMGTAGYTHYQENFTINRMVERHELLYEQLVGEHVSWANSIICAR